MTKDFPWEVCMCVVKLTLSAQSVGLCKVETSVWWIPVMPFWLKIRVKATMLLLFVPWSKWRMWVCVGVCASLFKFLLPQTISSFPSHLLSISFKRFGVGKCHSHLSPTTWNKLLTRHTQTHAVYFPWYFLSLNTNQTLFFFPGFI